MDEDINQYANDLLSNVDALLFGRVTYQLMADYWPAAATNPLTSKSDLEIADKMNNLPKIVFSKTLQKITDNMIILVLGLRSLSSIEGTFFLHTSNQ